MSKPTPVVRYRATETRPYPVELHLDGCTCPDCLPPLPLAKLTIAGAMVGNLIAFAWNPHGALTALAATIGVTL